MKGASVERPPASSCGWRSPVVPLSPELSVDGKTSYRATGDDVEKSHKGSAEAHRTVEIVGARKTRGQKDVREQAKTLEPDGQEQSSRNHVEPSCGVGVGKAKTYPYPKGAETGYGRGLGP